MSTMTPAELAGKFNSDGRTVRKFLRSITPKDEQPGKGSRWSIAGDKRSVSKLQKQFADWNAKQLADRAERAATAAQEASDAVTEIEDEVED